MNTINRRTGEVHLDRETMIALFPYALDRQLDHVKWGTPISNGLTHLGNLGGNCNALWTEKVLSVWLELPFKGKGSIDEADVGDIHEARGYGKDDGRLIVRPDEDDDHLFWLITGSYGRWNVRGCLWGRDAKNPKYLYQDDKRRDCFMVLQHDLKDPRLWMELLVPPSGATVCQMGQ